MLTTWTFLFAIAAVLTTNAQYSSHGCTRADAPNCAQADFLDTSDEQNVEWSDDSVGNTNSAWNHENDEDWLGKMEVDGETFVSDWESWMTEYGEDLIYQHRTDRTFFKEMNDNMLSAMYDLPKRLERKAMTMTHIAERKIRVDLRRRERRAMKMLEMIEQQKPSRANGIAIDLAKADHYMKLANTAFQKFKFHGKEAQKLEDLFYAESDLSMDDWTNTKMSLDRLHKMIVLRREFIDHRSEQTSARYFYLAYHSYYLMYKHGTQTYKERRYSSYSSSSIYMSQYLIWFLIIFFVVDLVFDRCMWFLCYFVPHCFYFLVGRLSTRARFFLYV